MTHCTRTRRPARATADAVSTLHQLATISATRLLDLGDLCEGAAANIHRSTRQRWQNQAQTADWSDTVELAHRIDDGALLASAPTWTPLDDGNHTSDPDIAELGVVRLTWIDGRGQLVAVGAMLCDSDSLWDGVRPDVHSDNPGDNTTVCAVAFIGSGHQLVVAYQTGTHTVGCDPDTFDMIADTMFDEANMWLCRDLIADHIADFMSIVDGYADLHNEMCVTDHDTGETVWTHIELDSHGHIWWGCDNCPREQHIAERISQIRNGMITLASGEHDNPDSRRDIRGWQIHVDTTGNQHIVGLSSAQVARGGIDARPPTTQIFEQLARGCRYIGADTHLRAS